MDKNDVKNRFETIKSGGLSGNEIVVDKETGIEYLFHYSGNAGGLSVLVDRNGKPKVNADYR